MGSAITTVGGRGGKPLYTFTGPNQDSGVILSTVIAQNANLPSGLCAGDLPMGYKSVLFQLVGTNTVGGVTVFGTTDLATAEGTGNEWQEIPAPSTEAQYQWSNPVSKANPGQAACFANAPWTAYKAVSSADFAGDATLTVLAAP